MKNERLYKGHRITDNSDPTKTFVLVDSAAWKKPCTISLERIGKIIRLKVEDDLESKNVTAIDFLNQAQNPKLFPNNFSISPKTHITIDENYLYVWVSKISKWKRILLSEWPLEPIN